MIDYDRASDEDDAREEDDRDGELERRWFGVETEER